MIKLFQLQDGPGLLCGLQKAERAAQDSRVACGIAGSTHGAAHRVARDDRPRQLHLLGIVPERAGEYGNRGNADLLYRPVNESNGPVADRSDWHHDKRFDPIVSEPAGPLACNRLTES